MKAKTVPVVIMTLLLVVLVFNGASVVAGNLSVNDIYVAYASWNDEVDRNEGYVWIYPVVADTDITLYYTSSTTAPIQIDLVAASWTDAAAGEPLEYGPLTNAQYFFKLVADKPVIWELNTINYDGYCDSSRFVISTQLTYLGTTFYFHADSASYEEVNVINPSAVGSGTVTLYNWTGTTWNYVASTGNIDPDAFWEYSVPETGFYRIESSNPVLVYEGRLYNQNMATGVTDEGDTVGDVVYCAVPYDSFVGADGGTTLHIMGVTSASYSIYVNTGTGFTLLTTGSVAAGSSTTHTALPMDVIYKIVTNSVDETIFVQYLTTWTSSSSRGGGEMIPGIDGGDTTNPGTEFILYFETGYQEYIDVLIPESGTFVSISGPLSTSFTSTVDDEAYHWAPGEGNSGVYTIASTKPIYVVIMSTLGDQQGYFVYNPTAATTYALTVHVANFRAVPISEVNVTVLCDNVMVGTTLTDANGDAIFQVEDGTYIISASRHLFGNVYREKKQNVTVTEDTTVTFVFVCLRCQASNEIGSTPNDLLGTQGKSRTQGRLGKNLGDSQP